MTPPHDNTNRIPFRRRDAPANHVHLDAFRPGAPFNRVPLSPCRCSGPNPRPRPLASHQQLAAPLCLASPQTQHQPAEAVYLASNRSRTSSSSSSNHNNNNNNNRPAHSARAACSRPSRSDSNSRASWARAKPRRNSRSKAYFGARCGRLAKSPPVRPSAPQSRCFAPSDPGVPMQTRSPCWTR